MVGEGWWKASHTWTYRWSKEVFKTYLIWEKYHIFHSSIGSHWFTCWNLEEVENKHTEGRDPNALANWKLSEDRGTIIYKSY